VKNLAYQIRVISDPGWGTGQDRGTWERKIGEAAEKIFLLGMDAGIAKAQAPGCNPGGQPEVVHRTPPDDGLPMPCCGQTPFEVPPWQRMTLDLALVSCGPPVISRCECGGLARHQAGCSWRTGYGSHVIRGEAKP